MMLSEVIVSIDAVMVDLILLSRYLLFQLYRDPEFYKHASKL